MAETVVDLIRPVGSVVWRGTMVRSSGRDDCYVKITRLGKRSQEIGFSSVELVDLRELVKGLIAAEGDG